MPLTVSDAGPINYLCQLSDLPGLLTSVLGRLVVPVEVYAELQHPSAPPAVTQWINASPKPLTVVPVTKFLATAGPHAGEQEAISLAVELGAENLLMDDEDARSSARRHFAGRVVGTIGILAQISLSQPDAATFFSDRVDQLRQTNFRFSANLNTIIDTLTQTLDRTT